MISKEKALEEFNSDGPCCEVSDWHLCLDCETFLNWYNEVEVDFE